MISLRSLPSRVLALLLLGVAPAAAGTAIRMDLQDLVDRAGLAVEARVLSARPAVAANGLPVTEYVLAIEQTFWGRPEPVRTVRLPGGPLGDGREMVIPGVPRLEVGEQALLFLSDEGPAGFSMPVGLSQGHFRLVRDARTGHRSLVRRHAGVQLVDPGTGVIRDLTADSFDYDTTIARIEAAAAERQRRAAARRQGAQR